MRIPKIKIKVSSIKGGRRLESSALIKKKKVYNKAVNLLIEYDSYMDPDLIFEHNCFNLEEAYASLIRTIKMYIEINPPHKATLQPILEMLI